MPASTSPGGAERSRAASGRGDTQYRFAKLYMAGTGWSAAHTAKGSVRRWNRDIDSRATAGWMGTAARNPETSAQPASIATAPRSRWRRRWRATRTAGRIVGGGTGALRTLSHRSRGTQLGAPDATAGVLSTARPSDARNGQGRHDRQNT